MKFYKNLKNKEKKELFIYLGIVIVFLAVGYAVYAQTNNSGDESKSKERTKPNRVELLNLKEKKDNSTYVKASGEVESKQKVDLKSEVSAKVRNIYVDLGQQVSRGQTLVVFENGDQSSRAQQARANLKSAQARKKQLESALKSQQAKLEKLKSGPRPEKLQQAKTKLNNSKDDLNSAKENLKEVRQKAKSDMQSKLVSSLRSASNAVDEAKDTILVATEIQYEYFYKNTQKALDITSAKEKAIRSLFDQDDAGRWIKKYISPLSGGLNEEIDKALNKPEKKETLLLLDKTITGLGDTKKMLQEIPVNSEFSTSHEQKLSSAKQKIQKQLEALSSKKEAINVQASVNSSSVQQAKSEVTRAKNGVASAKDNLQLVKSGAQKEDIQSQQEAVEQAQANLEQQQANIESARANLLSAQSSLSKTIIRSPIGGIVSAIEVDRGELVSPSQLVARVINTNGYQLKVYLSSQSARKIDVGNTTTIAQKYNGKVTNISPSLDPQKNKVEVNVSLADKNPDLIAGDFVDVKIKKSQLNDSSILLPIEAVSLTNNGSFVYTIGENNKVQTKEVKVDNIIGNKIKVSSGLEEIDKIIASTKGLDPQDKVKLR